MVMRHAYGFPFESHLADFRFVFFLSTFLFILFFTFFQAYVLHLRVR